MKYSRFLHENDLYHKLSSQTFNDLRLNIDRGTKVRISNNNFVIGLTDENRLYCLNKSTGCSTHVIPSYNLKSLYREFLELNKITTKAIDTYKNTVSEVLSVNLVAMHAISINEYDTFINSEFCNFYVCALTKYLTDSSDLDAEFLKSLCDKYLSEDDFTNLGSFNSIKTYSIWSEGYRANGDCGSATFHGESKGNSFREACINFSKSNKEFLEYFDESDLTYWGCKLFDNKIDAKRRFG